MDFELNKIDWFTPNIIAETPGFDKDPHGNTWYSVVFQGDAGTYLWLAKNRPQEGKKYYGHLELTKSGKATRFRTDKEPEGEVPVSAASNTETVDRQDAISRSVALNNAVLFVNAKGLDDDDVLLVADKFLGWLKNV